MPIDHYGVWVAKPVRVSAERAKDDPKTPHIHLFYDDGTGGKYDNTRRASINVKSLSKLSELVFWMVQDFRHPIVEEVRRLKKGFHTIPRRAGGMALDYIRGNLIDLRKGRVLPHDRSGPKDDIIDFVMPELQAAINRKATVYLFGEPYSDKQGIHDIHMNQGSAGRFAKYNGVWQDGGVLLHFPDENRFAAIFLAFASQAAHTDEKKGNALPGSQNLAELIGKEKPKKKIPDDLRVAIVAALINPVGADNDPKRIGRPEMVYLLNRSTKGISLTDWSLLNKDDKGNRLSGDTWLAPGQVRAVTMGKVPLSNKGGLISLLDEEGNKVDGVSYTKEQSNVEGNLVLFR